MTLVNPTEACLASVLKEYGTTKAQVKEDTQLIKTWLSQQPHLPHVEDDDAIQGMHIRCKCSVERTKQAWDMYFTLKTALPEFFGNRDPMSFEIQRVLNGSHMAMMPDVTATGYRVLIIKCTNKDPAMFFPEVFLKCGLMLADMRFGVDSSVGDIYIYDFENISMGHISRLSLPLLRKLELCAAEGYRARIKGVHFINAPPVIEVLMTMIKTVIKSKLASRHHVHGDFESLYKHVDRDVLPEDYGGKARKLCEISDEWRKKLENNRDWFLEQDVVGKADESKRPGKSFNSNEYFGFEGSFKKLCVD